MPMMPMRRWRRWRPGRVRWRWRRRRRRRRRQARSAASADAAVPLGMQVFPSNRPLAAGGDSARRAPAYCLVVAAIVVMTVGEAWSVVARWRWDRRRGRREELGHWKRFRLQRIATAAAPRGGLSTSAVAAAAVVSSVVRIWLVRGLGLRGGFRLQWVVAVVVAVVLLVVLLMMRRRRRWW